MYVGISWTNESYRMKTEQFYFAGEFYSVNSESADITNEEGYIVGNVNDILNTYLDVRQKKSVITSKDIRKQRSSVFIPKSSVKIKLDKIQKMLKGTSSVHRLP